MHARRSVAALPHLKNKVARKTETLPLHSLFRPIRTCVASSTVHATATPCLHLLADYKQQALNVNGYEKGIIVGAEHAVLSIAMTAELLGCNIRAECSLLYSKNHPGMVWGAFRWHDAVVTITNHTFKTFAAAPISWTLRSYRLLAESLPWFVPVIRMLSKYWTGLFFW